MPRLGMPELLRKRSQPDKHTRIHEHLKRDCVDLETPKLVCTRTLCQNCSEYIQVYRIINRTHKYAHDTWKQARETYLGHVCSLTAYCLGTPSQEDSKTIRDLIVWDTDLIDLEPTACHAQPPNKNNLEWWSPRTKTQQNNERVEQ